MLAERASSSTQENVTPEQVQEDGPATEEKEAVEALPLKQTREPPTMEASVSQGEPLFLDKDGQNFQEVSRAVSVDGSSSKTPPLDRTGTTGTPPSPDVNQNVPRQKGKGRGKGVSSHKSPQKRTAATEEVHYGKRPKRGRSHNQNGNNANGDTRHSDNTSPLRKLGKWLREKVTP